MAQHTITITGNIITEPTLRAVAETHVFRMRVASSRAVRDGDDWKNLDKLYISVECWGKLAQNCKVSLFKGLSVIVTGTLVTHEWEDADGNQQSRIVLRANHVGIDLVRNPVRPLSITELQPPVSTPDNSETASEEQGEHKLTDEQVQQTLDQHEPEFETAPAGDASDEAPF